MRGKRRNTRQTREYRAPPTTGERSCCDLRSAAMLDRATVLRSRVFPVIVGFLQCFLSFVAVFVVANEWECTSGARCGAVGSFRGAAECFLRVIQWKFLWDAPCTPWLKSRMALMAVMLLVDHVLLIRVAFDEFLCCLCGILNLNFNNCSELPNVELIYLQNNIKVIIRKEIYY